MSSLTPLETTKKYLSILADGHIHMTVKEGEYPGAVLREYETSDGKKGKKWELLFKDVEGTIKEIEFRDGTFGTTMNVTIGDYTLSINAESTFAEDLMKKLPNIDAQLPVMLAPYSFKDDKEKTRKGITVTQNGNKIMNYYFNPETKQSINGYPTPEGDTTKYTKKQWKKFYMDASEFLVKETVAWSKKNLGSNEVMGDISLMEDGSQTPPF